MNWCIDMGSPHFTQNTHTNHKKNNNNNKKKKIEHHANKILPQVPRVLKREILHLDDIKNFLHFFIPLKNVLILVQSYWLNWKSNQRIVTIFFAHKPYEKRETLLRSFKKIPKIQISMA